jgi:hypothetical protein
MLKILFINMITLAGSVPFRDRIEGFNNRLSRLTEHNDIPRISAAGNG